MPFKGWKDEEEFITKVAEYVNENIDENFKADDYELEKTNGKEETYYDFKLKLGDAITNSAITVVVQNNNIIEIVDNRQPISASIQFQNVISNSNETLSIKQRATDRITVDKNLDIKNQIVKKIYDEKENTFKWLVRTEIHEIDSDSYFVDEYYENV